MSDKELNTYFHRYERLVLMLILLREIERLAYNADMDVLEDIYYEVDNLKIVIDNVIKKYHIKINNEDINKIIDEISSFIEEKNEIGKIAFKHPEISEDNSR